MAQPNGSIHRPKSLKATTEIKEDPELWRDIQANVRKMDDLYDATFYTWLRSEDNVLVTASYLQRLTGEYSLDRIEHALCWLVNGWRLESIAILIKQVTFDWVTTKGDQGEIDRAQLVLALTDNWAIQFLTRLACTLLTASTLPPGLPSTTTKQHQPYSPSSSPSSPTSPHASIIYSTPPQAHGRRMAISRRVGPPLPNASSDNANLNLNVNVNTNTNAHAHTHSQTARAQASAMLSGSHARAQGSSKNQWPKHTSTNPVFYMNKSLFMEELSRKWSFCRLSEFFQCMDPHSGISHRFKCTLLKERALKEERSQKHTKSSGSTDGPTPPDKVEPPSLSSRTTETDGLRRVLDHEPPSDVQMDDVDPAETSSANPGEPVSSSGPPRRESESLHPFDIPQAVDASIREDPHGREGDVSSRNSSSISPSVVVPFSESVVVRTPEGNESRPPSEDRPLRPPSSASSSRQQAQTDTSYQSQVYSHDYNDDMNSSLRGFKGSDGHQHSRSQTVDAIMTPMGGSSHGSFAASSASASLSTLSLAESGDEKPVRRAPSRPLQAGYSQPLYRHATTLSVPFTSMVMSDGASSSTSSGNASSPTTAVSLMSIHSGSGSGTPRERHDSTSAKRKNSLGVNLANSSFSSGSTNSSSSSVHQAALSSSTAIFPGPRRTSTSASTTNEDLKRVRCSRQNSSTSGI
ncbi:hypothetical protein BG006_002723 [Podila minutissima]|uniref:Uncharacterized protein n=1 Tax=Podila minutissima TaxID=64525 RepID=A0A9P5SN22_9FUNG|nr:hypothetical protein BG006_002723 [Podila minutissima]